MYLHVGGLSRREEFKVSTHKVSAWDIGSQLVLRQTEQAGSSIQKVFDIVLCPPQKKLHWKHFHTYISWEMFQPVLLCLPSSTAQCVFLQQDYRKDHKNTA